MRDLAMQSRPVQEKVLQIRDVQDVSLGSKLLLASLGLQLHRKKALTVVFKITFKLGSLITIPAN